MRPGQSERPKGTPDKGESRGRGEGGKKRREDGKWGGNLMGGKP